MLAHQQRRRRGRLRRHAPSRTSPHRAAGSAPVKRSTHLQSVLHMIVQDAQPKSQTISILLASCLQTYLNVMVVEVCERCPRCVHLQRDCRAGGRGAPRQRRVQQGVRNRCEPEAIALPGHLLGCIRQLLPGRRLLQDGVRIRPLHATGHFVQVQQSAAHNSILLLAGQWVRNPSYANIPGKQRS